MSFVIKNNKVLLKNGKVITTFATPFQLPNLKLYLSATRMPQYANNTALPSFLDYSGNLYHATQATTSLQPLFKTNQFGTNSGIKFDGTDDIMNITSSGALDIFRNINQYTIQVLAKRSTLSVYAPILQFTTGVSAYSRFTVQFSPTSIQVAVRMLDATSTAISVFVPTNDLNPHLIQCTAISNVLYVYFDGVLGGSSGMDSATSSNTASQNINIGSQPSQFGSAIINGISINTAYSDYQTIQSQYRGYLSRGYL